MWTYSSLTLLVNILGFFFLCLWTGVKGLCSFMRKPDERKPGWQDDYFFVTPPAPWSFPHGEWLYANSKRKHPRTRSSSPQHLKVLEGLNAYAHEHGFFNHVALSDNLHLLSHFGFIPPRVPLDPTHCAFIIFL